MRYSSRKLSNDKVITTACNFWRQIACPLQVMSGNILILGNKIFEIPPFFQTRPGDLGEKAHACSLRFSALKVETWKSWNLTDRYPFSTQWLPRDHHADVLRQQLCISGLKYTVKRQKMERGSSKECSAFFLWRKGSFTRNRPSKNSTLFSPRRISGLFWNTTKAVKFLLNFQVHFALYGQDNYVFEREFCVFLNVS